jgi:hypothetical protein
MEKVLHICWLFVKIYFRTFTIIIKALKKNFIPILFFQVHIHRNGWFLHWLSKPNHNSGLGLAIPKTHVRS